MPARPADDLNFVNGGWPTLAPLVFARVGPLLSAQSFPTGMAGFFFRSRRANVGHGARILRPWCLTGTEGPWQHVNPTASIETTTVFFRSPPTLCPTLCADKNAPFHPRRPHVSSALQELHYFLPLLAIAAQRDFVSGFCSSPRKSLPSNLKIDLLEFFALPSLEPESSYLQALPSSCFRQALAGRQSEARLRGERHNRYVTAQTARVPGGRRPRTFSFLLSYCVCSTIAPSEKGDS